MNHPASFHQIEPRRFPVWGRIATYTGLAGITELEQSRDLADFECRHGRLAGDASSPCGCFASEARTITEVLAVPIRRALVPPTRNQSTRRFDHEEAVMLRRRGWTTPQLARKYGVTKQSVSTCLRKAGVA